MIKQFTIRKNHSVLTVATAVLCAAFAIFARNFPEWTTVSCGGFVFVCADVFVMVAAGVGGFACGMIVFSCLLVAELFRADGGFVGLCTLSTHLVLILLSSRLAYGRFFADAKKATVAAAVLFGALAFCWGIAPSAIAPTVPKGAEFLRLVPAAAAECALSSAAMFLFFRCASDSLKCKLGSGWLYTKRYDERRGHRTKRRGVLAVRVMALSLGAAVLLCAVAVLCGNMQISLSTGERLWAVLLRRWRDNLQLVLVVVYAAIPIAFAVNRFVMEHIVFPLNEMAFVMDKYFEDTGHERVPALPDLNIRSGDEIEKLYTSMKKMMGDMTAYIERLLQGTMHLTQGFMLALSEAVDAKDHYTCGHSERVAGYAKEIARRLGKSEEEQENIYTMGLLHDIGKIGVNEAIINKNGRLTEEEFAQIKLHSVKGHTILRNVTELPALATVARSHHERYDGSGYPDGLAGDSIPEEARIIAVADAYDAMTSKRVYSDARTQAQVRAEIERCKGTQFDPKIADIMLSMIDNDVNYTMHES